MNANVKHRLMSALRGFGLGVSLAAGLWACSIPHLPTSRSQPAGYDSTQHPSGLLLAEHGKACQRIIIAPTASAATKRTADYLAEKLQKISGAQFEIAQGSNSSGIVLGTIQEFPIECLQKQLELSSSLASCDTHTGREAFSIRTERTRLILLGGGEAGVSHAAARLLDYLGYRQFYPGPAWEVCPIIPRLEVNLNESDRPTILSRTFAFAYGLPCDPLVLTHLRGRTAYDANRDIQPWFRQNQLGESFVVNNVQGAFIGAIIRDNKAEFALHPEYYALIKGKRVERNVCITTPAVRAMVVKYALDYFARHPTNDMCSLEAGDGFCPCECASCNAAGDEASSLFALANEAARAVARNKPGKMVGILAYYKHGVPPALALEPNIHVQIAPRLFNESGFTYHELVTLWANKTRNIGVYDNFSTYQWGQDRLRPMGSTGPTADLHGLCNDIRFLASQGALSLLTESSVAWGAHGRGNYVATRLLWNPNANVSAILADFYDKAFGPAAFAMKRYFERVDGDNEFISTTMLGNAFRDVEEASHLARNRPDVQARLDHIKQFLYYNELQYRYRILAQTPDEKKSIMQLLLTHQYRTRYTYMTHWRAVEDSLDELAKGFNEPAWINPGWRQIAQLEQGGKPLPIPSWLVEQPYTHEETEQRFQAGLHFFQPQHVLETVDYSTDLVPARIKGLDVTSSGRQFQSAGGRVFLYSVSGEPLEVSLRSVKDTCATYRVRNQAGDVIREGELSRGDDCHTLSLVVPKAGLYTLESKPIGGMNSAVPEDRANTFSLLENRSDMRFTLSGTRDLNFFYVPKGTREFQYYWDGHSHSIFDPSGAEFRKVMETGYITVPVPTGMDGAAWSFNGRWDTRRFINIPNFIAPSPRALLVPREVAEKDGLPFRH